MRWGTLGRKFPLRAATGDQDGSPFFRLKHRDTANATNGVSYSPSLPSHHTSVLTGDRSRT
jgi:hypothetical protein